MKDVQSLVNSKAFRRSRKVHAALHVLTLRQKKLLRESPIRDFFDIAFLRRVGLERSEASLEQLGRAMRQILELLEYKTVGDIESTCNPYLLAELYGIGEAALAFLFDLMTALGLTFRNTKIEMVSRGERAAGAQLADRLRLPQ